MTAPSRSYDIDAANADDTLRQLQWLASQDVRARQRLKLQRTSNRLVSTLGVAAAILAIYDMSRLLLGMR